MTSLVLSSCLLLALDDPPESKSGPPGLSPAEIVTAVENVVCDAIAKAEPSVVAIHRDKLENPAETLAVRGRKRRPGADEPRRRFGLDGRFSIVPDEADFISLDFGSGVVIGNRGQILTAYHVVRGARRLLVRAANRQRFEAEILAADPRSDLAVIAPSEDEDGEGIRLKPLPLGDAGRLRKGAFLIALGNSFNAARDGKPSASWGILSNTARRLDLEFDETNVTRRSPRLLNYPTLLQLDSKLNLGMSGGAVVNLKGELVGLTTMAASPAGFDVQAGYAIPMDRLGRRAVETLKQGKEIEYGFLGIQADNNFSNRVGRVQPNSPAALGQLQDGDEIEAVGGTPVTDWDTLILAVNAYSAGETVRLTIRRADELIERTITLAKFPVDGEVIVTNRPSPWRGLRVDYASVLNYRTFSQSFLDATNPGVVVTEVEEGSPAAAAGIKRGQFIRKVGDKMIGAPGAFREAVGGLDGPVLLETDSGPVTVKESSK